MTSDNCDDFLEAVEQLRDNEPVQLTAHTSSVSADAWTTTEQEPTTQDDSGR
jgi:hypothetical protein